METERLLKNLTVKKKKWTSSLSVSQGRAAFGSQPFLRNVGTILRPFPKR